MFKARLIHRLTGAALLLACSAPGLTSASGSAPKQEHLAVVLEIKHLHWDSNADVPVTGNCVINEQETVDIAPRTRYEVKIGREGTVTEKTARALITSVDDVPGAAQDWKFHTTKRGNCHANTFTCTGDLGVHSEKDTGELTLAQKGEQLKLDVEATREYRVSNARGNEGGESGCKTFDGQAAFKWASFTQSMPKMLTATLAPKLSEIRSLKVNKGMSFDVGAERRPPFICTTGGIVCSEHLSWEEGTVKVIRIP